MELWSRVANYGEHELGLAPDLLVSVLQTLLVLALYLLVKRLLKQLVHHQVADPHRRFRLTRALTMLLVVLALSAVAKIWLLGKVSLATYFGILTAGLAIALRDLVVNLAGWVFLMWRQPFAVGDRIQVGAFIGDVLSIRMFMFSMMEVGNWVSADQSTGRILYLPNGLLFREPCANYTQGFQHIWHELPVTVTFESDWQRAQLLLTDIVQEEAGAEAAIVAAQAEHLAEEFQILLKHTTPIVWVEVVDIGVCLTLRYLCPARARRATSDRIWRRILQAFAPEERIDFAYPTQRFFNNPLEGKAGAGGSTLLERQGSAAAAPPASEAPCSLPEES